MVTFIGKKSVRDRTIFVNKGPISKKPLPIIMGNNAKILSTSTVEIENGLFNPSHNGYMLQISGSLNGRNDGTFIIEKVLSSSVLQIKESTFSTVDDQETINSIVLLLNEIKNTYEYHRTQIVEIDGIISNVHGTYDTINIISSPNATNLSSAIILANELKQKFNDHILCIAGVPSVHIIEDTLDKVFSPDATGLASLLILSNDIKKQYEYHRQNKLFHLNIDIINKVKLDDVTPIKQTYPGDLIGPLEWVLLDPQYGMAADDPSDVSVRINGLPVTVNAVIGQVGAIILDEKPIHGSDVKVDYSTIKAPQQKFLRLNCPELCLNQFGNDASGEVYGHSYPMSSYLIDTNSTRPDYGSPFSPKRIGWKYKGIERAYSAILNDQTTLSLNTLLNKNDHSSSYTSSEYTISYYPSALPNEPPNSWTYHGDGVAYISSSGSLVVKDESNHSGFKNDPPFYSKSISINTPSIINSAFRVQVNENGLTTDGVFTGVAFGISDGIHLCEVGFLVADAVDLSSAITMANNLKNSFNLHIYENDVHDPDDTASFINHSDAIDLLTLINLLNEEKTKYNSHISKGQSVVHSITDTLNIISTTEASDLGTAISLVNSIRTNFNSHLSQIGVHFINDTKNFVPLIKQIGICSNNSGTEFIENWKTHSVDWTIPTSYRLFRDESGNFSLFLSGDVEPIISVESNSLIKLADTDIDLNEIQQVFFGSISRESTSISEWQLIQLTVSPINSISIERNKFVEYDGSVVPYLNPVYPWINIGGGGFERINSNTLLLDSSAAISYQNINDFGVSNGAYRGYLRLEPTQTSDTTTSLEFEFSSDFYTSGVDNKSLGVILDDDNYTIQFAFLQLSPTQAETVGSISEPFNITTNDEITLSSNGGTLKTITFESTDTNVALISQKINAAFGFEFSSNQSGKIKFKSENAGSGENFSIISGRALPKLGLSSGIYYGFDSNSEPKVSWFGADFPDKEDPAWTSAGDQTSELIGRKLRIVDRSDTDFLVYSQSDNIITNQAISATSDWKLDFRFTMKSFVAGDALLTNAPYIDLDFAGLLVNVDEGVNGKNLEIHLSVLDSDTFISLVSFNQSTGNLDVVSQYAFGWNDGETHSITVYTNKLSDILFVYGDGILLTPYAGPNPSYSGLKIGISGPAITFGSGSFSSGNANLSTAKSVCEWECVNIIRDSKLNNIHADSNRYIGLYVGGPVDKLSSYDVYQIDWTSPHTYRIIRDPLTAVSLYIDGSSIPVISASYDSLSLPPVISSYLNEAASGRSCIAFGSFNQTEISRSRWNFLDYSIGKLNRSTRTSSSHQLLNQSNVVVSPEHLKTSIKHPHYGFDVYSGGTPSDEFIADDKLIAHTILNYGTPPVPMTEDMQSRGGLIKEARLAGDVDIQNFINFGDDITNFNSDTTNVVTELSLPDIANRIKSSYNSHILDKSFHNYSDTFNDVITSDAVDITSSIILINAIKSAYNLHRTQSTIHVQNDINLSSIVSASDAIDIQSFMTLSEDIKRAFNNHIINIISHISFDQINTIGFNINPIDELVILLSNDIRNKYLSHLSEYNVHLENDTVNIYLPPEATNVDEAITLSNDFKRVFNLHRVALVRESQRVHIQDDLINQIVTPDATEINSLVDLLSEEKIKYENHRVEPNVHSASVFILMNVPNRVLYEEMSFWNTEDGDDDTLLSPFYDELSFRSGSGISNINSPKWYYPATELPENYIVSQTMRLANNMKDMFNLHLLETGVHTTNDVYNTVSSPSATSISSLIMLLNEIKTKFNAHLIQSGIHITNDTSNMVMAVNASNLGTSQALANDLRMKFEYHRVSQSYHLIQDNNNVITENPTVNPGNKGWVLYTDGSQPSVIENQSSITFGTPNPTQTMYRYDGVMPSSASVNFELAVVMRVNSYSPPTSSTYDTRIYSGFTSSMDPGVALAVGFEFVGGKPMVKLHDINSDQPLVRIHDQWPTKDFRTYRIIRDVKTDTFSLSIDDQGPGVFDDTFNDTFN